MTQDASASSPGAIEISGSDASVVAEQPAPTVKAACGSEGTCLPDDNLACRAYEPPPGPVSAEPDVDAGGSASVGLDAGDGGSSLDGSFVRNPPRDSEPRPYACQIAVSSDSKVERLCAPSGTQELNEACASSMDCAPGMGCVGPLHGGRCLYFCCNEGNDSCAAGYFCAEQRLRVESLDEADSPLVPVCKRAENCSLAEAYPCEGDRCVCEPDTACTLINENGTTACLPPGGGTANEACPCSAGYVCSQATQRCVKTCDLDDEDSVACGDGRCQSTPSLPDGWGTCVGVPMTNASPRDP